MATDRKDRLGVVYSTKADFNFQKEEKENAVTLPPAQQQLWVQLDKKQRKGKSVTLVTGFEGSDDDLQTLARLLKTRCGAGGTAKNGEILIQGDFCKKVQDILRELGYKVIRIGG